MRYTSNILLIRSNPSLMITITSNDNYSDLCLIFRHTQLSVESNNLIWISDMSSAGLKFIFNWLYGWIISAAAATVVMPIDTVRRVIIFEKKMLVSKYRSAWHCTICLVKQSGIPRLWRGISSGDLVYRSCWILGTTANIIRSWSAGLMLAGFSILERLVLGQLDFCGDF